MAGLWRHTPSFAPADFLHMKGDPEIRTVFQGAGPPRQGRKSQGGLRPDRAPGWRVIEGDGGLTVYVPDLVQSQASIIRLTN
jgi:hypothetical protein